MHLSAVAFSTCWISPFLFSCTWDTHEGCVYRCVFVRMRVCVCVLFFSAGPTSLWPKLYLQCPKIGVIWPSNIWLSLTSLCFYLFCFSSCVRGILTFSWVISNKKAGLYYNFRVTFFDLTNTSSPPALLFVFLPLFKFLMHNSNHVFSSLLLKDLSSCNRNAVQSEYLWTIFYHSIIYCFLSIKNTDPYFPLPIKRLSLCFKKKKHIPSCASFF